MQTKPEKIPALGRYIYRYRYSKMFKDKFGKLKTELK